MADEVVGLQGSFSVDTSNLDFAASKLESSARRMVSSLQQVKSAADQVAQASKQQNSALLSTLIPLQQLQSQGLKFQDTLQKGGSGMTSFASKLMVLGQVADDAQYGFRAIVNQIPMVVTAFGGGLGLAGGIALAGVAINQLNMHWDKLTSGLANTRVFRSAADEMEYLGQKTGKTAQEQERLNKLLKEHQQIEEQSGRRPKGEQGRGKVAGEAITESPYDVLLRDVRDAIGPENIDAEVKKRMDAARRQLQQGRAPRGLNAEERKQIEEKVRDEAEVRDKERAQNLLRAAEHGVGLEGDVARKRLAALATANPDMTGLTTFNRKINDRPFAEDHDAHVQEWRKRNLEEMARGMIDEDMAAMEDTRRSLKGIGEIGAIMDMEEMKAALGAEDTKKRRDIGKEVQRTIRDSEDREGDLKWRLRGLTQRGADKSESHSLDSYESSIRAESAEKQLRKLHDIYKTLEEIKKNTDERMRSINNMVKRIPR